MTSLFKGTKIKWILLSLFTLLSICILSSGYYFYLKQRDDIKSEKISDLFVVADLKINQIIKWKHERISNALSISKNPFITNTVYRLLDKKDNQNEAKTLKGFLETIKMVYSEYKNIFLLETDKNTLLSTSDKPYIADAYNDSMINLAMEKSEILLTDFYHEPSSDKKIFLNLTIPFLVNKKNSNSKNRVIIIQIDPEIFLYPLIQETPIISKTFETLLIRKEKNEAVYLNELRHKNNAPLDLRIPIEQANVPAVMAIKGIRGMVEGYDYRGEKVVAVIKEIKDLPWILIAKVDYSEVFYEINKNTIFISIIAFFLILTSGLGLLLTSRIYYNQRLKTSLHAEKKYHHLIETLNEGIWVLDKAGNTTYANDKMAEILGYKTDDLLGRHIFSVMDENAKANAQFNIERKNEGIFERHEFELIKKDGAHIITTVCSSMQFDQNGKYSGSLLAVIDITDQKSNERALIRSEEKLRESQKIAGIGRWELDLTTNHLTWSENIFEIFEIDPAEFGASYDAFINTIHPADREMVNQAYSNSLKNRTPYNISHRLLMKDSRIKWVNEICRTEYDINNLPVRSLGVVQDITDRKLIEETQSFLIQCGSNPNENFFNSLAKYLAEVLAMDYVCIDRLANDSLTAQTLAIYFDGKFEDNVSYALKDTPCGNVIGKKICYFSKDIQSLFPDDLVLRQIGAESYIGTTLWSSKGNPIGLIAVIGHHQLKNLSRAEAILNLVAIRAAGELERKDAEDALKKSHENLESLVNLRTAELLTTNESLKKEISVRKKNEAEIKENQIFIQTILNSNPNIIYIFDIPSKSIIFMSQTFYRFLGYNEEDIIKSKNFFNEKLLHPEDLEKVSEKNAFLGSLKDGELIDYICRLKSSEGIWRWFLTKETIFKRDENNLPQQILGTAMDITEQKYLENELIKYRNHLEELVHERTLKLKIINSDLEREIIERKEAEQGLSKSKIILNSISEGVCTINNNKISSFNRAAESITGISAEATIGKNYAEVFQFFERKIDFDQILSNQDKPVYLEAHFLNNKGGKSPIGMIVSKIFAPDVSKNEIVVTFRDMSNIEILRKEIAKDYSFENIIAKSSQMKKIFSILPAIAESNSSVLIDGPTGTGKELLATAIHQLSNRKDKPYIVINCGAIPPQLMESELFGYKKGAFTDAREDKTGKVVAADKGTLFFDEIGELPPSMQVKLLRLLENFEVEPIGSIKPIKIDVRIIAATNRDLDKMVLDGTFRIDLYHRLNTVKFSLPPLSERKEDIPIIIDHYIQVFNAKCGKNILALDPKAMEILLSYNYPGNIRELEKILEYSFLICDGSIIETYHLPSDLLKSNEEVNSTRWKKMTDEEEKNIIISALNKYEGNRTKACIDLKMHYTTLLRKMKKYDLE